MRSFKRNQSGAILLEALVATVILAVGLTAVLQAVMQHLRASVVAQEYYLAAQVLEDSMTGVLLAPSAGGKPAGLSCPAFKEKKYKCEVTNEGTRPSPDASVVFDHARLKLSWPSVKGERRIEVPLYLAKENVEQNEK